MRSELPATPIDVLDISSLKTKLKVKAAVGLAEIFGFWKHPLDGAATAAEEMTLRDIYYWVYKCANPVTRAEKGTSPDRLFNRDGRIVRLPDGFKKEKTITFGAAGDLLRAEGMDEHLQDVLFEKVAHLLFDQTVSYANFESPITGQELVEEVIGDRGPPIECSSRAQFDALKGHKGKQFTVMNTANNHMCDMGLEGVETTLGVLQEEGILDVGTNRRPEEAGEGRLLTSNGIKIGFVSTTFGLNGHTLPAGEEYRVNVSKLLSVAVEPDLSLLRQQIEHCKSAGCDFIIGSIHWGYEFEFFPRQRQIDMAHTLIEWGVDAIIAHHPHVIQPVEYYRTKRDPDRVAVIAYSLGTLTWGFSAPHLVLSLILNLTLAKGRSGGKDRTYIDAASVTPVFRGSTDQDGRRMTRIEKLADHLDGRSSAYDPGHIDRIRQYAALVLGEEALAAQ